nr:golgin subfamily A member 6-like protein 6 [Salvelinus alpinus]
MMKLVFVFAVVAYFFAENLSLPVGKERQREDVVTRCLVEVLSKALTKPDSHPLDQECKDILKAGAQHAAPVEKKSDEVLTHEEGKEHEPEPEAPGADVKDIEDLLKSVEEKRETLEDEDRSQESWDLNYEKEKRIWKPTHRYHHKKPNHKRDEEVSEEVREEPDEDIVRNPGVWRRERRARRERSQESWSLGDEKEKRYRPTYRYTPKKHQKRDEEDEERSQESWSLGDEKEKRKEDDEERKKRIWKPTHRYHHKKHHKRSEDPSEEEEEEKDKRIWKPTHRYHHKKHHKRGADSSDEESEEKRSEESEEEDREKRIWKPTHRYHHKKHHKRDEELSEEGREEPDEERSQESWSLGDGKEKIEEDEDEREKRIWKPTHRYHHKKHHKRNGDSSEEEDEERRSDSDEHEEEKRHGDAEKDERQRDRQEALRYLAEKSRLLGEGEVYEKRSPWAYRGYYHPAWWKRSIDPHTPLHKMEELAKLLTYKNHQLASQSEPADEEKKRSVSLTPEEEKELENIAAMDMELQQISQKCMRTGVTR